MTVATAQHRLATLWSAGAAVVVLLMAAQHLGGAYQNAAREAWAWFSALILPVPSLIVGVLVAQSATVHKKTVRNPSSFWISIGLSTMYLVLVLIVLSWHMFSDRQATEVMTDATLFLGPLQALLTLSLTAFFQTGQSGG